MKSHANHDFHDDFETSEFRQRDRRRQRDYDRHEWKRAHYEAEDSEEEPPGFQSPPESANGNSV